jgi:hypothetical protein
VLAGAFALLLVSLVLTGCSAVDGVVKQVGGALAGSTMPKAGECWAESVSTITDYVEWTGGRPVPCTTRHDSYTYRVHKLSGMYLASWQKPGTDGELRSDVATDAWNTCLSGADGLEDFFPTLDDRDYRLYFTDFLPTLAQWKAGARWDRCDVSLITLGSPVSALRFDPLPTDIYKLIGDFEGHTDKYAYCIDTAEPATVDADPLSSKTGRVSDCTKQPQWHEATNGYFTQDDGAAFPSEDELDAFITTTCGPPEKDGIVTVAYPPSSDSWATGDRQVECWSATEGSAPNA